MLQERPQTDAKNQELLVTNPCPSDTMPQTSSPRNLKGRGKEAHGQQNHEDCEAALKTIGWCDVVGRRCELSPAKIVATTVMTMFIIIAFFHYRH